MIDKEKHEGLRILRAELENFKNIDSTLVDIGGDSICVIGKNRAGKSSFIQAILSPMDTKMIPSEPIRKGEERAKISIQIGGTVMGEQKTYTLDMHFSPKNKKGRLVLYNERGEEVSSPAKTIKSLIGNVSFDVMKWLTESNEKKINTVKALTGCGKEIDLINIDIDTKWKNMKAKLDRAEELENTLNNKQYNRQEIELYSNPIPKESMDAMMTELNEVSKHLLTYSNIEQKTAGYESAIKASDERIQECLKNKDRGEKEIQRLQAEIVRMQSLMTQEDQKIAFENAEIEKNKINIQKGKEWLATRPRPNPESINKRITDATTHNQHHAQIGILAEHQKEMIKCKQEAEKFKSEVADLEKKRAGIIAKSQLPIAGFTFTDKGLFLDGLPLEEGQINTERLFDVGVEIAMAMNPTLKTIFLHDGSLFDKASLRTIIQKIESKGYQAIVELVDYNGKDLEIKFAEEELK